LGAISGGVAADWLAKWGRVDGKPFVGLLSASGCVLGALVLTLQSTMIALIGVGPHRLRMVVPSAFLLAALTLWHVLPAYRRALADRR
jgi:hypothetical protein